MLRRVLAARAAAIGSLVVLATGILFLPSAGATNGVGASSARVTGGDPECAGKDVDVRGGAGADRLRGNNRDNVMSGGRGADVLRGLGGDDTLCGGAGPDRLLGGEGRDELRGGPGRDVMNGGPGRDVCIGGGGGDVIRNCEG
jgi:Ca2+-binding RTX toxin-like protein